MEAVETIEYKGFNISWYYDEDAADPRSWDNVSNMICWHGRYNMGDRHDFSDPRALFIKMICVLIPAESDIVDFLVKRADKIGIEYKDDEDDDEYNGTLFVHYENKYCEEYGADSLREGIEDNLYSILELVDNDVLTDILEPYAVISTISMYEHSGCTVWIGSPNDIFDSGILGIIYLTKKDAFKHLNNVTEENWRDRAWECMESEMQEYDYYIRGDVYGYQIEDSDEDVIDSCWGYYGDEAKDEVTEDCKKFIDEEIERREVQAEIDWEEGILNNMLEFTNA